MTGLERTERFLSTKKCLKKQKISVIRSQQNHRLNVMLFANNRVHVLGTFLFSYFNYVLGAYGSCIISGTNIHCTDTFLDNPGYSVTSDIRIKACRRPVKIDIELYMLGRTFRRELDGSQNIPLPGLSFGSFGGIVLNVNADPYDNGDLHLTVRFCNRVSRYLLHRSNHQIII